MLNHKAGSLIKDYPVILYFLSTMFMVFFSILAIQTWPSQWAQLTISFVCLSPAFAVLVKNWPRLNLNKKWSIEIKFVLIIIALGILNIFFSEDQFASLKGMSLFLMSGILVFYVTCLLFQSKEMQKAFFYLCSICYIVVLIYGGLECLQQLNVPGTRIMLFSSNPIPAGSLVILLSIGPIVLLIDEKRVWHRFVWISCLLLGAILITTIAQRGPALSMIVMAFILATTKRKGIWIFTLIAVALAGTGYHFKEQIPPQIKRQLLKKETLLVRLEFYHIALDIVKEKPIFGLGFNAPISRFIPPRYQPRLYPRGDKNSFYNMVAGVNVFDNMLLCFFGETGCLFTLAYFGLGVYLVTRIVRARKSYSSDNLQTLLILVVLAGFIVHSMTFDSLKNPHLNWIFHSLLGIIAGRQVLEKTRTSEENIR
jgi:hypothetical protein